MKKFYTQDQDGSLKQIPYRDWRPDPNGPTYPRQLLDDPDFRAEHGVLTERVVSVNVDKRFYTVASSREVVGDDVVVTQTATPRDIDVVKQVKRDEAAAKRYDMEVSGVDVGGYIIPTDRESQSKLVAVRVLAKEDSTYTVKWKAANGWITLDATQIINVADAVRAHVQSAFDWEAAQVEAIDTLTDAQSVIDYEVT